MIQTIIDFNFPIVRNYILFFIVGPFISFHMTFVFYMNLVYENRFSNDYADANLVISIILLVFGAYFLLIEVY